MPHPLFSLQKKYAIMCEKYPREREGTDLADEAALQENKRKLRRWILSSLVIVVVAVGFWLSWQYLLPIPEENPYGPEDFVSENGYLHCKTPGSMLGIDVSHYQGEIDWQKVRDSGVEFAFIRIGLRSARDGRLYEDDRVRENLQGAKDAGLKVGAYFFSQAMSEAEAQAEAEFAVTILKDFAIDLPVAYDWETVSGETYKMTPENMTACIRGFCSVIEKAGYKSMVYFNKDHANRLLNVEELAGYRIWFAMYDTYPDAPCKPDYWQYTNQGSVPGIQGNVDINIYLP